MDAPGRHTKTPDRHEDSSQKLRNVSLVLSGALIVIYVLQLLFPGLNTFALVASEVWSEPWTMVTSMFLHSTDDYMHLLNNLLFLAMFGFILENTIGTKRFLQLYLAAGLFANLSAFTFYPNSSVLGASGAISGVIGAIAVIRPRTVGFIGYIPVPMWAALLWWVGFNFLGSLGTGGSTAFEAHLYGLFFGALYGLFIRWKHPHVAQELRKQDDDEDDWDWDDEDVDIEEWEREHMM